MVCCAGVLINEGMARPAAILIPFHPYAHLLVPSLTICSVGLGWIKEVVAMVTVSRPWQGNCSSVFFQLLLLPPYLTAASVRWFASENQNPGSVKPQHPVLIQIGSPTTVLSNRKTHCESESQISCLTCSLDQTFLYNLLLGQGQMF